MRIHYLKHASFEGLGIIQEWAQAEGHPVTATHLYRGENIPERKDFELLVVMGGPMGVGDDERYPWLTAEKRFIEQAVKSDKYILGICLGAQLLAAVSGARVYRNRHKEIGWFPVTFTEEARALPVFAPLPTRLTAFHWHGDTFDLPHGAIRIAESEACLTQAFICNRKVIGLQFHLETDRTGLMELIQNCSNDLTEGPYVQSQAEMLHSGERFEAANAALRHILNRFCASE